MRDDEFIDTEKILTRGTLGKVKIAASLEAEVKL